MLANLFVWVFFRTRDASHFWFSKIARREGQTEKEHKKIVRIVDMKIVMNQNGVNVCMCLVIMRR